MYDLRSCQSDSKAQCDIKKDRSPNKLYEVESLETCEKPDSWHMVKCAIGYGDDFVLKNLMCVSGGGYVRPWAPTSNQKTWLSLIPS